MLWFIWSKVECIFGDKDQIIIEINDRIFETIEEKKTRPLIENFKI